MSAPTNDLDDLMKTFGVMSEDEKQENFEASTLTLVLRQLGYSKQEVEEFKEHDFTTDWFNSESIMPRELIIKRVFKFNLLDLLLAPSKSELLKALPEILAMRVNTDVPWTWVFKTYGEGRMVMTDAQPSPGTPYLAIPWRDHSQLYVTTFKEFFTQWAPS